MADVPDEPPRRELTPSLPSLASPHTNAMPPTWGKRTTLDIPTEALYIGPADGQTPKTLSGSPCTSQSSSGPSCTRKTSSSPPATPQDPMLRPRKRTETYAGAGIHSDLTADMTTKKQRPRRPRYSNPLDTITLFRKLLKLSKRQARGHPLPLKCLVPRPKRWAGGLDSSAPSSFWETDPEASPSWQGPRANGHGGIGGVVGAETPDDELDPSTQPNWLLLDCMPSSPPPLSASSNTTPEGEGWGVPILSGAPLSAVWDASPEASPSWQGPRAVGRGGVGGGPIVGADTPDNQLNPPTQPNWLPLLSASNSTMPEEEGWGVPILSDTPPSLPPHSSACGTSGGKEVKGGSLKRRREMNNDTEIAVSYNIDIGRFKRHKS
ncbi:uncharacterized protein LMH87_007543 [Akanthomyces muscarius]|uniref:Uncharacterized protein n=1 Tax=Akanthomyces muscarius TaxID=2231603 RepID=A0A9W8QKD6_AKAMU|nr:uncharacterized protein LMH87_007543 [Akanthomyces muscarius]KAJ4161504.1 hypothetical protein LMH87_007543 [Akanthomyces muscarius]